MQIQFPAKNQHYKPGGKVGKWKSVVLVSDSRWTVYRLFHKSGIGGIFSFFQWICGFISRLVHLSHSSSRNDVLTLYFNHINQHTTVYSNHFLPHFYSPVLSTLSTNNFLTHFTFLLYRGYILPDTKYLSTAYPTILTNTPISSSKPTKQPQKCPKINR